ncbi:MAG: tripartite tricarboxylate transporter substrate binding protein [Planctomycetes bacterium]|nr:tripartite tricarboxylate transporter substrate binding protein [Planctomycetota bacterium]
MKKLGLLLCAASFSLGAQTFPDRNLSLVVPFPPGGPSDALARQVAQRAGARLGQTMVVENVAGAAGGIGTARVARARADGYTLAFGTIGTHVANVALYKALQYDPAKDFEPVAMLGGAPLVLIAHPSLPVANFAEFVDYARRHTAKLQYGSAGAGSISHLGCLVLMSELKTDIQHIPYKGVAPAMTDLIGGQVHFMCDQTTTALPQAKGGKLKLLAALVSSRVPVIPDTPTAAEAGFPGVNVRSWNGVFAPRGTPAEVVKRLHGAFAEALADPELRRAMEPLGVELASAAGSAPEMLRRQLARDLETLVPVIRSKQGYLD